MRVVGLAALFLAVRAVGSAGELQGRVVDAHDGRPLPAAEIQLSGVDGAGRSASRTGADGRFSIVDLPAGEYRATISKSGYEARRRRTETVRIEAENERVSLTTKLRRSPVVSGRVVDAWGDPAPGVAVQLRQWRSSGLVRTQQPVQSGRTDDEGRFRLFDLHPGEYYLLATPPPAATGAGDAFYELTPQYYPGVESAAAATPIALDWGTLFEQADVELGAAPDTLLLGSAAIAGGGFCDKCQVMIEAMDSGFQVGLQPNEQGGFRIFGLTPGRYRTLARARGGGIGFQDLVQTGDRPAELALGLYPGAAIYGRLELENPPEEAEPVGPAPRGRRARHRGPGVRLSRIPPLSGERYETRGSQDEEGAFSIEGVPAGDYAVTPLEAPQDGYVAEILANGSPLSNWRLRIEPGAGEVEMVLRIAFDGGRVSGQSEPDPGGSNSDLTVVLLPVDFGGMQGFERYSGLGGPEGAFEIAGAPPGVYALGTVRRDLQFDWADPEVRARFYEAGKTVRVSPHSTQQVEAPLLEDFR